MERAYFMQTARLAFSVWQPQDGSLAALLWGDPAVTRYICAAGAFRPEEVAARLQQEVERGARYGVQYWPVFLRETGELVGCCGLRPHGADGYELGFHLRPGFWRQGYTVEAARAVMQYAARTLGAQALFAGHHPENLASRRVLQKLGFAQVGTEFYPPTGLEHPAYRWQPGAGAIEPEVE